MRNHLSSLSPEAHLNSIHFRYHLALHSSRILVDGDIKTDILPPQQPLSLFSSLACGIVAIGPIRLSVLQAPIAPIRLHPNFGSRQHIVSACCPVHAISLTGASVEPVGLNEPPSITRDKRAARFRSTIAFFESPRVGARKYDGCFPARFARHPQSIAPTINVWRCFT
jgi:hypothetical protein